MSSFLLSIHIYDAQGESKNNMYTMLWEYIVYNMLFVLLPLFSIIRRNLNFIPVGAMICIRIFLWKN